MSQKIKQDLCIGSNIRKIRKLNKMTQEQMTAKLQLMGINISWSIYSQIECGNYNIKASQLIALKEIFNVNYEDFFDGLSIK